MIVCCPGEGSLWFAAQRAWFSSLQALDSVELMDFLLFLKMFLIWQKIHIGSRCLDQTHDDSRRKSTLHILWLLYFQVTYLKFSHGFFQTICSFLPSLSDSWPSFATWQSSCSSTAVSGGHGTTSNYVEHRIAKLLGNSSTTLGSWAYVFHRPKQWTVGWEMAGLDINELGVDLKLYGLTLYELYLNDFLRFFYYD